MRRSGWWITLVLAIAAAGCAPGPTVPLLTDTGGLTGGGCYLSFVEGEFVPDPTYGTGVIEKFRCAGDQQDETRVTPVMWPEGYTGRQSGSEVEVVDRSGLVVVRTGTRVHIGGGYTGDHPTVWLACTMADNPPHTIP